MLSLGPLGFGAPWVLAALVALPALWWLMRALPPPLREQRFPGTALLAGLSDHSIEARRTPWWILLLRILALVSLIIAAAAPVWRPQAQTGAGTGPLLVVVDSGWAAAPGWSSMMARLRAALDGAGARPVALLAADGRSHGVLPFQAAEAAVRGLAALAPAPWETGYPQGAALDETLTAAPGQGLETLWLSDGLDHPGRAALAQALAARGDLRVILPQVAPASLMLAEGTEVASATALITESVDPAPFAILARGPDPQGVERVLERLVPGEATIEAGVTRHRVALDLPVELRNRVTRFEIEGVASAGATWLADDRLRRRKVALVGPDSGGASESQTLLSPLHYLEQALTPFADPVVANLADALQTAPDVIILTDEIVAPGDAPLIGWVEDGGTLIRFAGPRMAAAPGLDADALLPVRLRPGGRDVGGALSWGDPRSIATMPQDGPFAGLEAPADVGVRAQLMAEPAPGLAAHTLATLDDGTPLITRAERGEGQVVLVHVTANPAWSELPLTGFFVDMLKRLVETSQLAAQTAPTTDAPNDATGGMWQPRLVLDGHGRAGQPTADLAPAEGTALEAGPRPGLPAGIWSAGERSRAVNAGLTLAPANWPQAVVERGTAPAGLALSGWLLALVALLLAADAVASAALVGGKAGRAGRNRAEA